MLNKQSSFSARITSFFLTTSGQKRLVFLSSLIATAINIREPAPQFVENMNKALSLSQTSSASLLFPILVKKVFWKDRTVFEKEFSILISKESKDEEKFSAAHAIVQASPSALVYASFEDMAKDIFQYFKYHHHTQALA
jgi:hypothetical protein